MRYYYLLFIALTAVLAPHALNAQFPDLVWSDEFKEPCLPDTNKWAYDVGGDGWGNNELQYYTRARKKNARVADDMLIIEAHNEIYGTNNYTSARLVTRGKADWTYGRIEVRAKLPAGVGTWPAIWMLPTDWIYGNGSWPDNGEIDIMEHVGYDPGVVHGTIHTHNYNHMQGTQKGDHIQVPGATEEFHTYAVEWTSEELRWYVDDEHYYTFENEHTGWRSWPFDHPFHLILNIAVGGDWGGAQGVDESAFPVQLQVDYVRVYQAATEIEEPASDGERCYLFPNPSENACRIESHTPLQTVEVWNTAGKKLLHKTPAAGRQKYSLDVSNLQAGVYAIRIRTRTGQVFTRRLMKK